MTTTTIRISMGTRDILHELADELGLSMQEIAERAIERYYRQQVLEAANKAYAAVRDDPNSWEEWQAEQAAWDDTLADGL
jgi:predicted transcriptional regulator